MAKSKQAVFTIAKTVQKKAKYNAEYYQGARRNLIISSDEIRNYFVRVSARTQSFTKRRKSNPSLWLGFTASGTLERLHLARRAGVQAAHNTEVLADLPPMDLASLPELTYMFSDYYKDDLDQIGSVDNTAMQTWTAWILPSTWSFRVASLRLSCQT